MLLLFLKYKWLGLMFATPFLSHHRPKFTGLCYTNALSMSVYGTPIILALKSIGKS